MATFGSRPYSTPRNVNLKDGQLRFGKVQTSNPFSTDTTGAGLYVNSSNELVFWNKSSASTISSGATAGSLDGAYDLGRTVTIDNGAIVLNDGTSGAANILELNKTGAGSGNVIDVDFTAAATGNAINLDMGSAVAAVGIVIDSEAGARTGIDLLFTDDSTGANHDNITINKSGAGAGGVGFRYTGSYAGSPAGQVFLVTFDNSANLDTEVTQITTGTGNRGIMFDYNFGHADSGTTSHIWDVDVTGILNSNVLDIAFGTTSDGNAIAIELDNAVAETALRVTGSGTRTQPYLELISDSTGSAVYFDIDIDGGGSGNVIDITTSTTFTGSAIGIDLNGATGGYAIRIDGSNETRTVDLITVVNDGGGNKGIMLVTDSNTGSGHVFDINTSGIGSGNVFDITYSAADTGDALKVVMADNVAGGALVITGAGTRTDSLVDITTVEDGSMDGIVLIQSATGVFTGHMLTVHANSANTTGGLLHLDLGAGVAYKAITFDHAGAREVATILATFDGTFASGGGGTFLDANITMTGSSASPFVDVDITGAYTGNIIDILIGASLATGVMFKADLGATATGAQAVNLVSGAMTRTVAIVKIDDAGTPSGATFDINHTGASTGIWFDLDATAATTGAVFDFATSAASTGTVFEINMTNAVGAILSTYTLAGTRTVNAEVVTDSMAGAVDIWEINDSGTKSGQIWDVNISGNTTGNVLDIVMSSSKVQGHAVHVDLGTDLAGNALLIDAAGTRTAPIIYIANTGADGGLDDHVLFINQTGLLNSDIVNLTFATAASDGNALKIAMGTNVAGSAIQVTSAGTGTSGEGCVVDVTHTGDLAAGANVVDIISTGSPSSTSHTVSIQQTTGAGTAGAYALYVNATGANVEGIRVAAGAVSFAETLSVTGATTLTGAVTMSSTVTYKDLTEVVTETNVILAAESGSVYFLSSTTEFASTLPAPAAGLHFTFFVDQAPSGASYTIASASGTDNIHGVLASSADAGGSADSTAGTAADTITFVDGQAKKGDYVELWCDGTSWYAVAMCSDEDAITFTAT